MSDHRSTELVAKLREHAERDNCVSHNWGGTLFDAGHDCAEAADEIERLQLLVADYGGQLAALTARTVDVPAPKTAEENERDRMRMLNDHDMPY